MNEKEKPREGDKVEQDVVFYYSREHRMSRAPEAVRALNNENHARSSLGKKLFGTKGNVIIFISIIIICAMFSIISRLYSRGTSVKLGANTLELTILREGEVSGLSIEKTMPKTGEFYIGAVDIAVSPMVSQSREGEAAGEIPQVLSHRVFFNPTDTESFFISLPFDGDTFYVFLTTDDEQKAVRVR